MFLASGTLSEANANQKVRADFLTFVVQGHKERADVRRLSFSGGVANLIVHETVTDSAKYVAFF